MGHKGKKKHKSSGAEHGRTGATADRARAGSATAASSAPVRRRAQPAEDPLGLFGALGQLAFGGRGDADSPLGTSTPVRAMTDALTEVARTLQNQPLAERPIEPADRRSTDADEDQPSTKKQKKQTQAAKPPAALGLPVVDTLTSGLGLQNNPLTGALGAVTNLGPQTVASPLGGSLRQATDLVTAPLRGVAEIAGVAGVVAPLLNADGSAESATALRKRGTRLIRISYKPEYQRRDLHPSFSRIIDDLLPDEARILRFMGVAGTQPLIDVRTKTLFQIGSVLLVGDISMVAQMAGCHWPDRDRHYFANLHRLGLINLSDEPVDDYRSYALLEVQPVAVAAIESVPKAVTVFRSIRLSPFGEQFIDVCLDTDGYHAGGWDTDGRQDKILGKGPRNARTKKAG